MSVINAYVNSDVAAGNLAGKGAAGAEIVTLVENFSTAAGDDDGSVYRIFKALDSNLIPLDIEIFNEAITGGTDWDLGFYETDLGAVVSKDCLLNGGDLSSAHIFGAPLSGISALAVGNIKQSIYEILGLTNVTKKASYDLCLTANTVGSAAKSISVRASFLRV